MITRTLAEYAVSLRWETLPEAMTTRVREVLLDALACEAAGRRTPMHERLRAAVERAGDVGASTDTFLAGAAMHALELDDAHKRSKTHPAAAVVPAVRAAARLGGADGPRTLASIVAGYETMLRIGAAVGPADHWRAGWHATCTAGALGAAAGAACALGLDADVTAQAMGHAVALMAGNHAFVGDGSMAKPVQVGNTARVGFFSALMAAEGVTGTRSGLEEPHGGYFKLFGGDANAVVAELDRFHILEVAFKPYPCCRTVQGAIDAALALRPAYRGGPVRVRTFAIAVEQNGFYVEERPTRPRYSLPYVVAAALADGRVDLATFEPSYLPTLYAAEKQVTWSVDPALEARYPADWAAEVEIEGAAPVLVDVASGDPRNPMSPERWRAKITGLAGADAERLMREVAAMADPVPA